MSSSSRSHTSFAYAVARFLHICALGIVALAALSAAVYTGLSVFGVTPWIEVPLMIGGAEIEGAGVALQIALTALLVILTFYIPSSIRVLNLETSHRNFQLRMEDIANAYWAAHRADRTGIFKMKSEFDAVKERMLWLRDHPELGALEPDVMELAAQMSEQSRELATVYSDESVARARDILAQRLDEAARLERQIEHANAVTQDIRQMADQVEMDEQVVGSRLERLKAELSDTLGRIGLTIEELAPRDTQIIPLPSPPRSQPIAAE